jgi:hypothetical protein
MLSLSFSKLVSTPTEIAWSQVYNAGNLFASLSLSKKEPEDGFSLSVIGKEIFSNLEAEFFTLEDKSLGNIKQAVEKSARQVPDGVIVNLSVAFFKENVLYLFVFGVGKIIMRRGSDTGVLLETQDDNSSAIHTASGLLKDNDVVLLQTPQFAEDMPNETVSSALDLDLPNDIAEALSPGMHEQDDGAQAAIIIKYKDAGGAAEAGFTAEKTSESVITEESLEQKTNINEEKIDDDFNPLSHEQLEAEIEKNEIEPMTPEAVLRQYTDSDAAVSKSSPLSSVKAKLFPLLKFGKFSGMNHRRKLFLSIAVILFVVLTSSILLAKQRQESRETTALFESIYDPALKDYEDGKSIQSINEAFARDEFLNAQKAITDGLGKFKKGSDEEKRLSELLAKVEAELGVGSGAEKIGPKEVKLASSEFLSAVRDNKNALGLAKGSDNIYILTDDAVITASDEKEIIENDGDWDRAVALAAYQGNMYILDQGEGVIKYTAGASGFGKSSYFRTKPSTIKDGLSMAIDGSVWILFRDGSIGQFTSGESDGFRVKGLDRPFEKATKIFTNLNTESVYILDNGNSRIVRLSKDGNFEEQYVADIIKSAREFEVLESEDKILLLSNDKFYELPL